MSSKDAAFDSGGKTIIRPSPDRGQRPVESGPASQEAQPVPAGAPTIFDPSFAQLPPQGWSSGTVIYQGTPVTDGAPGSGRAASPAGLPTESGRQVPQSVLLNAGERIEYSAANPIIAAAAPLLMLLGRLRLMVTETRAAPLAEHVAVAIKEFDRKIAETGVPTGDARIAKLALCETADDIIANLPGHDRHMWARHSMVSRFFQTEVSGTAFFEALNKILSNPEPHYDLLELMHACLSLGFEGQYRGVVREDRDLERVRRDVYETLRYFRARAQDDISPRWQGLAETTSNMSARPPFWSVAAGTVALLAGCYFLLRTLITADADAVSEKLLALNPTVPVTIERAQHASFEPLTEEVRSVTQLERIRVALAKEIAAGGLTVDPRGDFIVVEINNLMLFDSGKAEVKAEFEPIAGSIAAALDPEPGQIRIVGHTDNVKPRRSSAFKSNYDLSVARARAVEKVVAPRIGDPSRIAVEGKGEDEPLAGNETPEGRARNRRVDLMILREELL